MEEESKSIAKDVRAGSGSDRRMSKTDDLIKTSSFTADSIEALGMRASRLTGTNANAKTFTVG